jgi:hypothetical protein
VYTVLWFFTGFLIPLSVIVVTSTLTLHHLRKASSYRAFQGFGQAMFPDGGSDLGSSQYSILLQLPPKILLDSKVVKIDPKIIISFC